MRTWRVLHWSINYGCRTIDHITVDDNYAPDQFRKDCEAIGNHMCDNGDVMFDNAADNLMWLEGHKKPINIIFEEEEEC